MITEKDISLYYHLLVNCRFSNKELARALSTSEPNILKKIKKLESMMILKYDTILNHDILPLVKVWYFVKTKDIEKIKDFDSVYVAIEAAANYNLIIGCMFRNKKEKRNFERVVKPNKSIVVETFNRKIPSFIQEKTRIHLEMPKANPVELDENDVEIMNALCDGGGRLKLMEIANKTGLSYDIVKYRFRRLQKNGYFLWFVAQPFQRFSDFRVSYITFKLKNKKDIELVKNLDNVFIYTTNNKNEIILSTISESSQSLLKEMAVLYDKLRDVCTEINYYPIIKTHVVNRYPLHKLLTYR